MRPDPKPPKRIRDKDARSRKLESDPICRSCEGRATDGHHILLRSQRGDDVEDNVMPLCHDCHMEYHAARLQRPLRVTVAERLYVLAKLGTAAGEAYITRRRYE